MDKYIRVTFAGKPYRINREKAKEAAASAFAFVCWCVGWSLFFSVIWERVLS